jgi:hypothetical protein
MRLCFPASFLCFREVIYTMIVSSASTLEEKRIPRWSKCSKLFEDFDLKQAWSWRIDSLSYSLHIFHHSSSACFGLWELYWELARILEMKTISFTIYLMSPDIETKILTANKRLKIVPKTIGTNSTWRMKLIICKLEWSWDALYGFQWKASWYLIFSKANILFGL